MSQPELPLAELFQAHRDGLAGAVRGVLGRSADVAEVLQDAFLKCWRARDGAVPRDPVAWIFVVTWNAAVDARRRRARRPLHQSLDEDDAMELQVEHEPSLGIERREQVASVRRAIAGLADTEQQVFLLRVSGGLTFEAVAQALAIPVGTAKTRMRSALQKVRRALGVAAAAPDPGGRQDDATRRTER